MEETILNRKGALKERNAGKEGPGLSKKMREL